MFVVMDITGLKLEEFGKALWPFLVALLCSFLVITCVPSISLLLPRLFYGYEPDTPRDTNARHD